MIMSLIALSSCVTMDGKKSGRTRVEKQKPGASKPGKDGEKGRNGADSKLESLSNLPKLAEKTKQENIAILNDILRSLNKNEKDNKGKNGKKGQGGKTNPKGKPGNKDNQKGANTNYQENIEFAEKIIKSGQNLDTLKTNVDNFVNEYDNTDGYFLDHNYKIVKTKKPLDLAEKNLNIIKRYYLDKTKDDCGSQGEYIKYLKDKVSKSDMSKRTFPDPEKEPDKYITKVEEAYKEQYKKFGIDGNDLNTLRGNLQNKIAQAENKIQEAKQKILEEYKKIDPSYTANELPAAIGDLIEKYKGDRKKIIELLIQHKEKLKGLKNVPDVTNPDYKVTSYSGSISVSSVGDDYVIKMGDREFAAKDFILDSVRGKSENDEDGKRDNSRKPRKNQKDKDNKKQTNKPSFYKAERQISSGTKTFGKFMPNIETELNKYGSDEIEQSKRRENLKKLFEKFENGQCDDTEKNKIKDLLSAVGNNIGIKEWKDNLNSWNKEDKDKFKLLKKMLSEKTKPSFDIKVTENKKDIVRLGGKLAGLTFSDFGLWEVQTLSNYHSDNKNLMDGLCKGNKGKKKSCKSLLPLPEEQSEFNAFTTGADKFKRKFKAGGEGTTKFTGKTIAGVTVSGDNGARRSKVYQGTATLDITNNTGMGDFNFNYDNWYKFKFKNINLTDPNGYQVNNHDVEVGGAGEKDFKLNLGQNEKLKGKLKGTLYGAETDKPTEGSGVFNIDVPNGKVLSDTYKTMKIDGAFGMKVQN